MKNIQKQPKGGFHVIGLMVAEAVVSLGIITLSVRIGLGPALIVFFVAFVLALYVLPKIHMPSIALPKIAIRIRKTQFKTVQVETRNSSVLV